MEPGDKCVCSEVELYNAFGDKQTVLVMGQRLTVTKTKFVSGMRFYSFKETPEDNFFAYDAFTPMRNLN